MLDKLTVTPAQKDASQSNKLEAAREVANKSLTANQNIILRNQKETSPRTHHLEWTVIRQEYTSRRLHCSLMSRNGPNSMVRSYFILVSFQISFLPYVKTEIMSYTAIFHNIRRRKRNTLNAHGKGQRTLDQHCNIQGHNSTGSLVLLHCSHPF